jgi:hypothetical protein
VELIAQRLIAAPSLALSVRGRAARLQSAMTNAAMTWLLFQLMFTRKVREHKPGTIGLQELVVLMFCTAVALPHDKTGWVCGGCMH